MAKKSKILKNILTGVSAFTMLTAGSAYGVTSTGSPFVLGNGNESNLDAPVADYTQAINVNVDADSRVMTINGSVIVNQLLGNKDEFKVVIEDGSKFTFNEPAISAYKIIDTEMKGGAFEVKGDYKGDIVAKGGETTVEGHLNAGDATTARPGAITITNAGTKVNVRGNVANNVAVTDGEFSLGEAANGTADANIGGTLTVNSGKATLGGENHKGNVSGAITVAGGELIMTGDTGGALNIGDAKVNLKGEVTGAVAFTADSAKLAKLEGTVASVDFDSKNATLTFAGISQVSGQVDNGNNVAKLHVTGGANAHTKFANKIGATNAVNELLVDANTKVILNNDSVITKTILKEGATLEMATNAVKHTGLLEIQMSEGQVNRPVIVLKDANHELVGDIKDKDTTGKGIGGFKFDVDAREITVVADTLNAETLNAGGVADGQGVLNLAGNTDNSINVTTNMTDAHKAISQLNLEESAGNAATTMNLTVGSRIVADLVDFGNTKAHKLVLGKGAVVKATAVNFHTEAAQEIVLEEGAKIEANIDSANGAGVGIVTVNGDANIVGKNLGATNALNKIDIAAGKTLLIENPTVGASNLNIANGINLTNGATLELKGDNVGTTISGPINTTNGTNGTVKISANDGHTIAFADIGHAGNGQIVKTLEINIDNAQIDLKGSTTNIEQINIPAGKSANLKFNANAAVVNAEKVNGQVNVEVAHDTNFNGQFVPHAEDKRGNFIFSADKTVTLADKSVIKANELRSDDTVTAKANLIASGEATIDAKVIKAKSVTLNGAGNVYIPKDFESTALTIGADKEVEFGGDVTVTNQITAANGATFVLKAEDTATLDAKLTAAADKIALRLEGGDVTYGRDDTLAKSVTFNTDKEITLDTKNDNIGAIDIVNNKTHMQKVKFGANTANFTGKYGTNPLHFEGADNYTVGSDVATNVTFSTIAGKTITLNKDAAVFGAIGTSEHRGNVTFSEGSTISGATYAGDVVVSDTKTATFKGSVEATKLHLAGANASVAANFDYSGSAEFKVNTPITSADNDKHTVTFGNGNIDVKGKIGEAANAMKAVNFATTGDNEVKLNADIYATNIDLKAGKYSVKEDITLTGAVKLNGSVLNLASQKLTVAGDVTTDAAGTTLKATLTHNSATNVYSLGEMYAKGALPNVKDLVKIDIDARAISGADGELIKFIVKDTAFTDAEKEAFAEIQDNGDFVKFTKQFSEDNKTLSIKLENTADDALKLLFDNNETLTTEEKSAFKTASVAVANGKSGSAAHRFLIELAQMDDDKRTKSLTKLFTAKESQGANNIAADAIAKAGNLTVNNRLSKLRIAAPAAGDDAGKYGVWGSYVLSKGIQDKVGVNAGYENLLNGIAFGVDNQVTDTMVIGGSYLYAHNKTKFQDEKLGDETVVKSNAISLYAVKQINYNGFIQGIVTGGNNKISSNSGRLELDGQKDALASYTSMSFVGEVLAGYVYDTNRVSFTPKGGLRYSRLNDTSYTETGTTNQNLNVKAKAHNKTELVGALHVDTKPVLINESMVSAGVHAQFNQDISGATREVIATLDGVESSISVPNTKPIERLLNVGANLNVDHDMFELSLGLDGFFAEGYKGYQGSVKVKLNF